MKNVIMALLIMSRIMDSHAQKLDGVYKGYFIMKGTSGACSAEMTVTQSGNNLNGKTVYTINESIILGTTFTGIFNPADSTFTLTENNTTECKGIFVNGFSCYGCKKTIKGKWAANNSIGILKAAWQPKTDSTRGDCYNCPSIATCAAGTLELRKNYKLTGNLQFYLDQWRSKKTYETDKQWRSRKDSAPLIKQAVNNYLENTTQWSNASLVYDPENEYFTISIADVSPFILTVKREEARCFAENFKTGKVNSVYDYDEVRQVISVKDFIVRIKCDDTYKTYPAK